MATAFWERFTSLCENKKTTPNAVMLETGLNTGNPPAWRKGRIPGTKAATTLAQYFDVSVDYLLGAEQKETAPSAGASKEDVKFALFGSAEVSDELYERIVKMARIAADMEAREKGG